MGHAFSCTLFGDQSKEARSLRKQSNEPYGYLDKLPEDFRPSNLPDLITADEDRKNWIKERTVEVRRKVLKEAAKGRAWADMIYEPMESIQLVKSELTDLGWVSRVATLDNGYIRLHFVKPTDTNTTGQYIEGIPTGMKPDQ